MKPLRAPFLPDTKGCSQSKLWPDIVVCVCVCVCVFGVVVFVVVSAVQKKKKLLAEDATGTGRH